MMHSTPYVPGGNLERVGFGPSDLSGWHRAHVAANDQTMPKRYRAARQPRPEVRLCPAYSVLAPAAIDSYCTGDPSLS